MLSQFFWERLNIIAGYFAIAVTVAFLALSAHLEIKDLDLWLHLKTGQIINQTHRVPTHDSYSASLQGKDWNNHEWLFQSIIAHVHGLGGFDALIMMQVVVVTVTLLVLIFACYRRNHQLLFTFGMLLTIFIYQSRLTIRPDIYSILFVAIFSWLLHAHYHQRWAFVMLALVQVLWVNMHGFFFMGPVLVWLMLLGAFINQRLKGETLNLGFLPWAAVFIPLVCLLNPGGIKGAIYPIAVMLHINQDSSIFFKHIVELARPITKENIFTDEQLYYKLMIFFSFYSFVLNRKSLDLRVVFVWLFFLAFSLVAVRNLVFFGVIGMWAMMINTRLITFENVVPLRFVEMRFKLISAIVLKIFFIGWVINACTDISGNGYMDFDTYERKSEFVGVSKRNFPYKAVDFLVTNQVKGNFFNDFNSGAYLIGRAYPNVKVFIDGRTEVYGGEFFKQYQDIWRYGNKKTFLKCVKQYGLTGIFLNSYSQDIPAKTVRMLYTMPEWRVVYFDDDAIIFLKDIKENQALIKKFGIDLSRWQTKPMSLYRLGSKRVAPFAYVNRASTLYALGFKERAINELRMALKIAPDYGVAYALLGRIYLSMHEDRKAFESLRLAMIFYPSDGKSRLLFAQSYERLRVYQGGMKQYERLFNHSKYSKLAKDGYNRCLIALGDRALGKGQYQQARKMYQQAINGKVYLDAINYRIGLTYLKSSDKIMAQRYFDAGLVVNPNHRGIKKVLNQQK